MGTKPKIYTKKYVLKEVKKLLKELRSNEDVIYLGQLFLGTKYTRQRFSEWSKEFNNNEEISDTIKKIKEILETRVVVQGMQKKLNPAMAIFNLKNNYGWTDKDIEPTVDCSCNQELKNMTDEELNAELYKLEKKLGMIPSPIKKPIVRKVKPKQTTTK